MGQRFYGDVFGGFIMVIIVSNTIIMLFYAPRAEDTSQSETLAEFSQAVDVLSNAFALIYFVEFLIKIVGLGPQQYFRDKWNCFDFFLVLVQVRLTLTLTLTLTLNLTLTLTL